MTTTNETGSTPTTTKPGRRATSAPRSAAARRRSLRTLEDVVLDYRTNHRVLRDTLAWFAGLPSLDEAVQRAGLAQGARGKRFPHQTRMQQPLLARCAAALRRRRGPLENAPTFAALHEVVDQAIGGLRGVGRLCVYDTALRIGAHRGLVPDVVHLHAGARDGALALGFPGSLRTLALADLPGALAAVQGHEAEDILCIYKDVLGRFRGRSRRGAEGRRPDPELTRSRTRPPRSAAPPAGGRRPPPPPHRAARGS